MVRARPRAVCERSKIIVADHGTNDFLYRCFFAHLSYWNKLSHSFRIDHSTAARILQLDANSLAKRTASITLKPTMSYSWIQRYFPLLAGCFLLLIPLFTGFFAQNSQPPPGSSPSPSPTPSITPTPTRSPSPTPLPGAQNFHQWGSITVFNGLPSDSVRAIAQTPDGVMWFGTDNGLARFDGRRIQNFSLGEADADRILVLKTDPNGELWIGTQAGAFIYAGNRFQGVQGTQNIGITAILIGSKTYLGTDTGLVLRVTLNESRQPIADKQFADALVAEDNTPLTITNIIEYNNQVLAATSGRGVFVVKENSVSEFPTSPRPVFVNTMAASPDGKLWLGTDAGKGVTGIYKAGDRGRAERIIAPTAKVLAIEANDTGLWAGTERYGLFHVADPKLKKIYSFEDTSGGLRSDTIYTLFTDREGVIWIGTNRGVSRFDRLGPMQQTVSDIPNSNFIRTLTRDGELYAGSNRGLFTKEVSDPWSDTTDNGVAKGWIEIASLKNKVIYALQPRAKGAMLVGGPDGMFDITGRKLAAGDVRSFAAFKGRDYAAVFGRGVVEAAEGRIIFQDQTATSVFNGTNRLWIGTGGNGLFSYDGTAVKKEAGPEELKSGTIWNIFQQAPEAPLYIAGQHGVFVFRNGNVDQIAAVEDVRDVFERDEHIWAATTTRGLIHARRDERFGWLVSALGFEQGLPSEKAFSIRPSGNDLMIATNRGIVTYKPGTTAPKLIATRILSQRVHDLAEQNSNIELDYPQNSLLVEVAGQSSRTFPEEFQYAFVLKNEKGETLNSRVSNEPQYAPADLKPGNYTIETIAFDRDLLASEPLAISFSVGRAPFPWTATALGALLAVAVIALIWAIVERGRIVQRNRELATARLDLAHEAERERSRIARDLHDQTLADLRDLIMKSDRELPSGSGFREDIESISTEVRRICEDLSPSVLENVGLIASLEFLLSHTVLEHKFDRGDNTDDEIDLPMNVQLQIYRIAQEVLTNIKQHANASLVEMGVSTNGSQSFELTILNDGKPFTPPESMVRGGRGIAGIRTRAALIHATPEWDILAEGRSRFRLKL